MEISNYFLETKCSIREASKYFKISKSTIHNKLHKYLPTINKQLFNEVQKILDYNYQTKHIKGGNVTKNKYKKGVK